MSIASTSRSCSGWRVLLLAIFVWLAAAASFGQEYRATITGIVTDSSKAVIPNAIVSVRNLDTGEVIHVKTNNAGVYTVPYLHPGHKLQVSAEAPGFKRSIFPPVLLAVSQTQTADFALQVGTAATEVTVTSQAYEVGLDSANADRGMQVDNQTLTQLPLDGRNAMSLLDTLAGVTNEGGAGLQMPATDMYYASQYTVNGTATANIEYTIDGQPNNSSPWYNNGPSSIPSIDALQEMKVITNPYDAQLGHSAGGVVSMELKSGTNAIHGAVYEFARRTYMDANSWINNYNGIPRSANDHKEDQYGFEVAGPVYIPHLYDGRNKTFFMVNWEKYNEMLPQYLTADLPNPAWLKGDFTQFTDNAANCMDGVAGCLIPVYDPATRNSAGQAQIIQNSAGQYNKVDPSRFNPVAVNLLTAIISDPNLKPIVTLPTQNPWEVIWADNIPQHRVFNNFIAKGDQVLGAKNHLSVNFIRQLSNNVISYTPAGVDWQNGENFKEYHYNVGLDWVHTFRSNLLLDFHASYQRYWRSDGYPSNYDPAKLGFNTGALPSLGFPIVAWDMQQSLSGNLYSAYYNNSPMIQPGRDHYYMPDDSYSYAPTVTYIRGKHTLRAGLDVRLSHVVYNNNGTSSISMETNGTATSESFSNGNNYNDQPTLPDGTPLSYQAGNAILDFLLSQPAQASLTDQVFPYFTTHYFAPWVQDDWKVTPKLTVNLGLRYDLNGPPTARHNSINTGFNFTAVNPIDSLVNRALDPSLGTILGGYTFPTSGKNTAFGRDYSKIQPRVGFAYQLDGKTVIRGGFGRLVENPPMAGWMSAQTAAGFSANTPYVNSPDGGHTFFADNLTNPFAHNGISTNSGIASIPGASLGLKTNLGGGVSYINPNFELPYVDQFSFGVQRATPKGGRLEVSYVGSRSKDQPAKLTALNTNIQLYASCDRTKGTATNADPEVACAQQVPNPFQGVAGVVGSLYTNSTTSAQQLASPYPEFTSITENEANLGRSWYNSMQTIYSERIQWTQINTSWTWSKTMQSMGYVDQYYLVPQRTIAGTDRKNRVTLQAVLDIPIGRKRKYFSGMNRAVDAFVGGWELASDYFWESGNPVSLPTGWNLIGDIHRPKTSQPYTIDLGMNDCYEKWINPSGGNPGHYQTAGACSGPQSPAWQQQAYHSIVTEQPYSAAIRVPNNQQIDTNLSKSFRPNERIRLELRLETFNLVNHPTWQWASITSSPTANGFGTAPKANNGASNNSRRSQLGAKLTW